MAIASANACWMHWKVKMQTKPEMAEADERGGVLRRRFHRVSRRKRDRQGAVCQVLASKIEQVEAREQRGTGSGRER